MSKLSFWPRVIISYLIVQTLILGPFIFAVTTPVGTFREYALPISIGFPLFAIGILIGVLKFSYLIQPVLVLIVCLSGFILVCVSSFFIESFGAKMQMGLFAIVIGFPLIRSIKTIRELKKQRFEFK